MVDISFIQNPYVLDALAIITDIAGPNFNLPYDSDAQPSDPSSRNLDDLLQFQLPGGSQMQGMSDSISQHIGHAINTVLIVLAPFISAYGLILPILGVIRGIIEVICALLNPFAVIRAIIRLFRKWIPPFISLFPVFAAIIFIINIIKLIIAVIFFVLTVVIPMIQLLIKDIKDLSAVIRREGTKEQKDGIREKLIALLVELLKQLSVLQVLKPIVDLIFMILQFVSGFPCDSGDTSGSNVDLPLTPVDLLPDASCCDDNVCPPIFKNMPKGIAFLLPTYYSESEKGFAWTVIPLTQPSGAHAIPNLYPYLQDFKSQLNPQIDEPVDESMSAGQTDDNAHFKLKLTSKRGGGQSIISPIVKFSSSSVMVVMNPDLFGMHGIVNYEIVPNWEVLIKHNVVGLGCHPDVVAAKNAVRPKELALQGGSSALKNHPFLAKYKSDFDNIINYINKNMGDIHNIVKGIVFKPPIPSDPNMIKSIESTDPKDPPYDAELAALDNIGVGMTNTLLNFVDNSKQVMNNVLSTSTNSNKSDFTVDKSLVSAGFNDKATITVIPKDFSGSLLLKNLPKGVDISISLFTDFGTIQNQISDKSTGKVTAELISLYPGSASITAKINSDFVTQTVNDESVTKVINVKFVSDAILPKRRVISKPHSNSDARSTIVNYNREPGEK